MRSFIVVPATCLVLCSFTLPGGAGCSSPNDGESETEATDSDDETGATDPTTGATDGETGEATEGSEDSEGSSESGEPPPVCEDRDFELLAGFTVSFTPPLPAEPPAQFEVDCTVTSILQEFNRTTLSLDCGERAANIALELTDGYQPLFVEGDVVALAYRSSQPFWQNEWFAIRSKAEGAALLLGGVSADAAVPVDDDMKLFAPVSLAVHDGVCALPMACDDPFERLAVEFTFGQDSVHVVDGTHGFVGDLTTYELLLPTARSYRDMDCGIADVPPSWFTALIVLLPEG